MWKKSVISAKNKPKKVLFFENSRILHFFAPLKITIIIH